LHERSRFTSHMHLQSDGYRQLKLFAAFGWLADPNR
jgi:hypothetical protein